MNDRFHPVPPLEPGDHLTRDEFERRYDAMPSVLRVCRQLLANTHDAFQATFLMLVGEAGANCWPDDESEAGEIVTNAITKAGKKENMKKTDKGNNRICTLLCLFRVFLLSCFRDTYEVAATQSCCGLSSDIAPATRRDV